MMEIKGNRELFGLYRKPQNRVIFAVDFLSISGIVQRSKRLHSGSTKISSFGEMAILCNFTYF